MPSMHLPAELHQTSPPNHPDLPEMGADEDYVDYICRVGDWLADSPPPAPTGFVRVPCEAEPQHHPIYAVAEDVFYPGHCLFCERGDIYRDNRRLRCERDHRRWKSWAIWGRLARKGYALGIIAGSGTSYGGCEFCGIGRQHMRPKWRGKRPYILGVSRDTWACLRRGHRRQEHVACGLCSVCCPCPECGSTDPTHYSCEAGA